MRRLLLVQVAWWLCAAAVAAQVGGQHAQTGARRGRRSPPPSFIAARHAGVLQRWLAARPGWRPARKEDAYLGINKDAYDFIESQLRDLGREPYYVADDFNGDGAEDFAVILLRKLGRRHRYAAAIFNGPFAAGRKAAPTFYTEQVTEGDWLFWFEGDEYGSRFIIGPPASDAGYVVIPRGRRYVVAQ